MRFLYINQSMLYEPARRGYIYHRFNKTGVYSYKTSNDQIGTIIVQPYKAIHNVQIYNNELSKLDQIKRNIISKFNIYSS
jgi:hypothetical protein